MKILSVKHKGLRRLLEKDETAGLPAQFVDKIRKILAFLQDMESPDELHVIPNWKAHLMTGDRKGTWSLFVSRNWRITFRIDGTEIEIIELDYEDYRKTEVAMTETELEIGNYRLKSPPHPGGFVKTEIVEPMELSVTEASKALGITRVTLSAFLNERASLSPNMALRIEKAFGVPMDTLMRMQSSFDIAQARKRAGEIDVARYQPKAKNEPYPGLF